MAAKLTLTRSAMLLALTGGVEFGLQILIPMILVRHLDPAAFGHYRVLWLATATVLAFAPAFMPQALFYFLPRAAEEERHTRISSVLVYLMAGGTVVALAGGSWNPLLPQAVRHMADATGQLGGLFMGLWVLVSLAGVLPVAEGRVHWQARSDIAMALLRTALLGAAAVLTHDVKWLAVAMLAEAALRLCLLVAYLRTRPGGWRFNPTWSALKEQLRYALPFAMGNAMFLMRAQADQWVVATMLPAAQFAAFSIAAVFLPVGTLVRQPIINAMMGRLNQASALGNTQECARLLARSIGAMAMILLPVAGGLFAVTSELQQIIYTERYAAAAPVMRVYLVGIMLSAVAVGHVLPVINEGRFAARSNTVFLLVSVVASIACAQRWGLTGAAWGSVGTLVASELWSLRRVSDRLHVRLSTLIPWQHIWPPAFACLLALAGVALLGGCASSSAGVRLLQKTVIFTAMFAAGFIAAGGWQRARILVHGS